MVLGRRGRGSAQRLVPAAPGRGRSDQQEVPDLRWSEQERGRCGARLASSRRRRGGEFGCCKSGVDNIGAHESIAAHAGALATLLGGGETGRGASAPARASVLLKASWGRV